MRKNERKDSGEETKSSVREHTSSIRYRMVEEKMPGLLFILTKARKKVFYAFPWANRDFAASMRSLTPLFPSIKPNKTNVIIAPIKIVPTT